MLAESVDNQRNNPGAPAQVNQIAMTRPLAPQPMLNLAVSVTLSKPFTPNLFEGVSVISLTSSKCIPSVEKKLHPWYLFDRRRIYLLCLCEICKICKILLRNISIELSLIRVISLLLICPKMLPFIR